jgi:hypothetical protein
MAVIRPRLRKGPVFRNDLDRLCRHQGNFVRAGSFNGARTDTAKAWDDR